MSENNPVVKNFFDSGHDLYLNELYYIAYSDQEFMVKLQGRKTQKEFNEKYSKYLQITTYPEGVMKFKALAMLQPEDNPNFINITGRMIIDWTKEGFIPQFDYFFKKSRRLVMVPLEAYEYYEKYSKAGHTG